MKPIDIFFISGVTLLLNTFHTEFWYPFIVTLGFISPYMEKNND